MPRRLRLPVTIVAALAVAEAAVIVFRPRDQLEPVDVAPQRYFSTDVLDGELLRLLVDAADLAVGERLGESGGGERERHRGEEHLRCFIIGTYFSTILMLPTIPASKCPATRQP